jgi:hypothetical protein
MCLFVQKEIWLKLDNEHRYKDVRELVETTPERKITTLWNQQLQTDRTIPNNKPDIIIGDKEKGTCILRFVAISGYMNLIKKETLKVLKYKSRIIEMEHKWK